MVKKAQATGFAADPGFIAVDPGTRPARGNIGASRFQSYCGVEVQELSTSEVELFPLAKVADIETASTEGGRAAFNRWTSLGACQGERTGGENHRKACRRTGVVARTRARSRS